MKRIIFITLLFTSLTDFAQSQSSQLTLKPSAIQGKDAQVYSLGNNNNYGNFVGLYLNTWTNSGNLGSIRFFIEFDFSSLPNNVIIDSAYLKLYYDSTNTVNYRTHMGQNDTEIKRVTSPWVESTVTWNNQPTTSNSNISTIPPFITNTQNYNINVSALVQDMVSTSNYGFMFKMLDENNTGRASIFASSDHPDSTLHPELNIYYRNATGINQNNINLFKNLEIYPNPSNDVVNVKFADQSSLNDFNFEIINMAGQTHSIQNIDGLINVSSLAKGIYFLKLSNKYNESYLKKIIVY